MLRSYWRLAAFALAIALAFGYAAEQLAPRSYVASGGVLLPAGMVRVQYTAGDPGTALRLVQAFIEGQEKPLLVDPPAVVPAEQLSPFYLAAALPLLGLAFAWPRRRSRARSESELVQALGAPLVAARPLAAQELARQLRAQWFGRGRATLAVVSAEDGAHRSRVTAELARALARMGEPTLVIDADFRAPGLHRAFGLPNRAGLADFLEGREPRLAQCSDNLSVLVAGRSSADPLELLSRPRMQHLLLAAAKRYRVVLVDTPAAARGPDLQLPAAFGGGALVVAGFASEVPALERLRELLAGCKARVVGTVLSTA
jgi:Mrp family chromosome partitioning ATPase